MKPQLKKCGAMRRNPLQGWFSTEQSSRGTLEIERKGPERMGERPWLNAMRVRSFPKVPNGQERSPKLAPRVTSGHLQLPVLRWAETNMENNTRFRCSFVVVKTIAQILHWLPGVGTFHRSRECYACFLFTGPRICQTCLPHQRGFFSQYHFYEGYFTGKSFCIPF